MRRLLRFTLAILPALLVGLALHGSALREEVARRKAAASPLASLDAPLPSTFFDLHYWRSEAAARTSTWRAAAAVCAAAEFFDRPNCLAVYAARHLETASWT